MKKILLCLMIFFPLSVFASTYDDMANELLKKIPVRDKTKVLAVMPFTSDKKFASDAVIAAEEMTKALINAGATVSERSQIDKLVKEQELHQVGVLTNQDAGEIGQGLGAKYVILGSLSEINRYGEEGNIGLKINVKLVVSSNYKVLAAASGEALAGDASSRYRRKAPKKAAEYPQFLEVFGGANLFKYTGNYDGTDVEYDSTAGFSAGARYIHESKGFFTSGWEFVYSTRDYDKTITRFDSYKVSWFPMIRIPLWEYMPSLPDYTSIHLGYSIGLGINNVTYTAGSVEEDSNGVGICTSAIAGLRLGVSDTVSFFGEFRYAPSFFNNYYRSHKTSGKDIAVSEEETGPSVYFGISLTP
jgi:hypothetical protein